MNGWFGCIGCRQVGFSYLHVRVMAVNRPLYVIQKHKISECSHTLRYLWRVVLICWQVGQLSHSYCSNCCLLISQLKNLIYLFLSFSHTQHEAAKKRTINKKENKKEDIISPWSPWLHVIFIHLNSQINQQLKDDSLCSKWYSVVHKVNNYHSHISDCFILCNGPCKKWVWYIYIYIYMQYIYLN